MCLHRRHKAVKEVKAAPAHQEFADWMMHLVKEYGEAGVGDAVLTTCV